MSSADDRPGVEPVNPDAAAEPPPEDQELEGAEPALRFHERAPWKYLLPIALLALVWLVIGLVCSPAYFRF